MKSICAQKYHFSEISSINWMMKVNKSIALILQVIKIDTEWKGIQIRVFLKTTSSESRMWILIVILLILNEFQVLFEKIERWSSINMNRRSTNTIIHIILLRHLIKSTHSRSENPKTRIFISEFIAEKWLTRKQLICICKFIYFHADVQSRNQQEIVSLCVKIARITFSSWKDKELLQVRKKLLQNRYFPNYKFHRSRRLAKKISNTPI